jgi:hypothetical protein
MISRPHGITFNKIRSFSIKAYMRSGPAYTDPLRRWTPPRVRVYTLLRRWRDEAQEGTAEEKRECLPEVDDARKRLAGLKE